MTAGEVLSALLLREPRFCFPNLPNAATNGAAALIPSERPTRSRFGLALQRGLRDECATRRSDQGRFAQVIDPELGYNVVDLGFIYDIAVEEESVVRITMTTTTPGCPAAGYLKEGVANSAWSVADVEFVDVRVTFEPAWKPDMMTAQAGPIWDLPLAIDLKCPATPNASDGGAVSRRKRRDRRR